VPVGQVVTVSKGEVCWLYLVRWCCWVVEFIWEIKRTLSVYSAVSPVCKCLEGIGGFGEREENTFVYSSGVFSEVYTVSVLLLRSCNK
jgi:hypothetical protein